MDDFGRAQRELQRAKATPWRLLSYSLPLTVGVAGVMGFVAFGIRLRIAPAGG